MGRFKLWETKSTITYLLPYFSACYRSVQPRFNTPKTPNKSSNLKPHVRPPPIVPTNSFPHDEDLDEDSYRGPSLHPLTNYPTLLRPVSEPIDPDIVNTLSFALRLSQRPRFTSGGRGPSPLSGPYQWSLGRYTHTPHTRFLPLNVRTMVFTPASTPLSLVKTQDLVVPSPQDLYGSRVPCLTPGLRTTPIPLQESLLSRVVTRSPWVTPRTHTTTSPALPPSPISPSSLRRV